jgi:peptidoglycan/LPS O-acetylase OafA/YrhL
MSYSFQLKNSSIKSNRLEVIDQLKGVAILLVLIYHACGPLKLPNTLQGQIGVDIFLILSGFTLALRSGSMEIGTFLKRRFLRIFPLYWAALLLFVTLNTLIWERPLAWGNILLHVLGLHGFGNDIVFFYYTEAFWYIGLIVPLYLIFLVLKQHLDDLDVLLGAAGIGSIAMCYYYMATNNIAGLSHLSMRIPSFFLGIAAGRIASGAVVRVSPSPWLFIGGYALYHCQTQLGQTYACLIAGAGIIATWIAFAHYLSKVAIVRWILVPFGVLGTISYELYLFHQPLFRDYNRYFQIRHLGIENPNRTQMLIGMLIVIGGIIVIALSLRKLIRFVSHRRIELKTK